jgi:hypothetical protein
MISLIFPMNAGIIESILVFVCPPWLPGEHHPPAISSNHVGRHANGKESLVVLVLSGHPDELSGQLWRFAGKLPVRDCRLPLFCHRFLVKPILAIGSQSNGALTIRY